MSKTISAFLGTSNFANEIRSLFPTLSANRASVMLVGERGTGKRLIAQHIHYAAQNGQGYFFEVNCKAFSDFQILESFETVEKLTSYNQRVSLFISFIELMPVAIQQKLCDLINKFTSKNADIKLITSTEQSLEGNVSEGKFSSDLYYRLNAVVLNVIPLRQRKEDILPIAKNCMATFSKKSGYEFTQFSDEAESFLENGFWSGNIDELFNAIQRAFIVGTPPVIKSSDFIVSNMDSAIKSTTESSLQDRSLKNAMDIFKKEYLTKILEETGWNQTKAAQILGIQRTYVIRLMNELQIRRK